jgi:serine-type D-Ala-D-Ala carboxypeptidase (penicillin-binding protein 5/6)
LALVGMASAGLSTESDYFPSPPQAVTAIPVSLLVDQGSGQILQSQQPDLRFVPASMTKVMTAYVAFELIAQGKLDPAHSFTVRPETGKAWQGKGSSMNLRAGETVTLDNLLQGITTVSANDASVVLAEGAAGSVAGWTALMNAEAVRLHMTNSHFATPNGWPDGGATYVSARDLVRLGDALIARHPEQYRRYFGKKQFAWNGITAQNHDPTTGVIPGADGIKTGHTNEAGYNFLGSAERGGRRLLMVIGGAHSETERTGASRALLEWGFAAWQGKPLFAPGAVVGEARVQGGDRRHVGLLAPHTISAVTPRGASDRASLRLVYHGPLKAPLAKGAAVAELEILVADMPPSRVPLVAAQAVGKAGPFDRLWNGLMGLVS